MKKLLLGLVFWGVIIVIISCSRSDDSADLNSIDNNDIVDIAKEESQENSLTAEADEGLESAEEDNLKINDSAEKMESDIFESSLGTTPDILNLGSAGTIDGRTLIISIFADDSTTSWNYESEEDVDIMKDTIKNLRISTTYLAEQVAHYGKSASFIFDWEQYEDIGIVTSFSEQLVREDGSMYFVQRNWIENNIDIASLKTKYKADNVIFIFFFNTDYSNQVNPWSLGYSSSPQCDLEIINVFVRFDDQFLMSPSSYAHEIMHLFGAHDLYYANSYIPQEYVDYCKNSESNDIMYTVRDGETITNDFTELDAYYVGLTGRPDEADVWGLAKSEHEE